MVAFAEIGDALGTIAALVLAPKLRIPSPKHTESRSAGTSAAAVAAVDPDGGHQTDDRADDDGQCNPDRKEQSRDDRYENGHREGAKRGRDPPPPFRRAVGESPSDDATGDRAGDQPCRDTDQQREFDARLEEFRHRNGDEQEGCQTGGDETTDRSEIHVYHWGRRVGTGYTRVHILPS